MVVAKVSLMVLCATINIFVVHEPVSLRLVPRGNCKHCCPISEKRDIKFMLTTANNTKRPDILVPGDAGLLERSHFNRQLPTVIYMHGFLESVNGSSSTAIREAYLRRGGWNIIIVDWSSLTAAPFYITAAENTKVMGAYLAKFILFLENSGISIKTIHVVGFSLGAEAAGFAGQALRGRLPRITGLDPAFPLFTNGGQDARLSPNDAQFVDVIHSDGGIFGQPLSLGHVDFYPNNGRLVQPGCTRWLKGRALMPYWQYVGCSHQRSWRFYAESVTNECGFPSSRCTSWNKYLLGGCRGRSIDDTNYLGIAAKRMKSRSNFYLKTGDKPPYGNKAGCSISAGEVDIRPNVISV